ncbi:MAG: flagellar protein FlaG [Asticcacaulis sp.]|uniref:flagellar protein FlaG n=1 Tax=Asticcacaulis sp. TaxID=1872648 RepID=UPI003F7BBF47
MEMINNVVNFPQLPDVTGIKPSADVPPAVTAVAAAASSPKQDDKSELGQDKQREQGTPPYYTLRLTIDKDPQTGEWVYKAIDRYTGEVVRQMPRQGLLDMKRSAQYEAGSFIKTDI